jgi:hypothetical protein
MKLHTILFFLLCSGVLLAQNEVDTSYSRNPNIVVKAKALKAPYDLPDPVPFAKTIRASDIQELLTVLAGDSMEGRETGEPGQRKAAAYIASQFKAAGIAPKADRNSYFQDIHMEKLSWTEIGLKVNDQDFKNREDFFVYPAYIASTPLATEKEVVFVGYGIDDPKYSDYGKTDVEGKAVIFYDGEPLNEKGVSLVTGTALHSEWSLNWRKKVEAAKKKGATMAFVIDPKFAETVKTNKKLISTFGWTPVSSDPVKKSTALINTLFVTEAVGNAIMGGKFEKTEKEMAKLRAGEGFKPVKIKTKIAVQLDKETTVLEGSNVVAVIEGSDEKLKNEYVFVTAHYDHLGQVDERIYYGADDNGSGTSGVIEIARAFAEAKKQGIGPKRTVVCMLVSGEEKGLLGSKFYVEFPLFPLDKTVVDINIDMIGRVDAAHASDPNYVYVIGANRMSAELQEIQSRNNEMYTQMALDYKYNDPKDPNHYYERSDHYNFAEKGIPAVFYFNGTHADYHKATDTVDKINFDAAAKRAQLAFYTAWEIANRPYRLIVDKKK